MTDHVDFVQSQIVQGKSITDATMEYIKHMEMEEKIKSRFDRI